MYLHGAFVRFYGDVGDFGELNWRCMCFRGDLRKLRWRCTRFNGLFKVLSLYFNGGDRVIS